MTVASATSLSGTGCASGAANVTAFGTVLPGTSTVTSADCVLTWGSSNDTSMLKVFQADRDNTALDSTLDASFNGTGKVSTALGSLSDDWFVGLGIQGDGKVVVADQSHNGTDHDFSVVRYTASGALDTTFGTTGIVNTAIGTGNDYANALAIQGDGKLVVAGWTMTSTEDFAVVRYNTDGSLDTTFNTTGKVTTPVGTGNDQGQAMAIQADGKIVVAGLSRGSSHDVALVRYNTDGSLDTTFNTTGKVVTAVGSGDDWANAVAIQEDGKIVLTAIHGTGTGYEGFVLRYNADGSLDTTFGTTGTLPTPMTGTGDRPFAVAIQGDSKIVAVGGSGDVSTPDFAAARFNADGTLDLTFNGSGLVTTDLGPGGEKDHPHGMAIQPDGRIVAAGNTYNGTEYQTAMVRWNADGSLDTTFNGTGKVITPGPNRNSARAVAIQADDRIITAGHGANGAAFDVTLVRYNANPVSVPDYAATIADWSAGPGMFGACLRAVSGSGVTGAWTIDAACPATNGTHWNAVPTTSGAAGAKIAASPTAGVADATASLRFGLRTASNLAVGTYQAPLVFEVLAPNA